MTYRLLGIATDTTGPAGIRRPGIPLAIDRHPHPWPLLLPRPAPHTMRTAIVNIDTRLISTLSSAGFMPCRNTSYVLSLAILLLLTLGGSTNGQALAASESGLEDRLREIAKDKVVILSKINQVPSRVETEVDRIMGVMDKLTANEISKLVDEHNSEVNESLQGISLPKNIGAARVYWESIKFGTGYDRAGMHALVQDFLRRAQAAIEPSQEKLAEGIENTLNEALRAEMIQARKAIRAPFQRLISTRFPELVVPHLRGPSFAILPELEEEDWSDGTGIVGGSGILILTLSKEIRKKILGKITKKALGRVAGSLVPFVGTILVAYEVWDASKAKADLEQLLRKEFLAAYEKELSATIGSRPDSEDSGNRSSSRIEEKIKDNLNDWFELCLGEAKKQLAVAEFVNLSPPVRTFIREESRKDPNTDDIFAAIDLVGNMFPLEMISKEPFSFLWNMAITAPNREELNHLAHELGNWLLEEYRQHGDEVLVAANRLGIGPFLEVVRNDEELNWFDTRRMFEQYPRNLSERARRGLVLALLEQVAEPGVDQATLESINRNEEFFRSTAPLLQHDVRKLYWLFEDTSAVEIVERAFQRNVDVARSLLIEWPVRTWGRYREKDRFDALFNVAEYRVTSREQAPRDFAREVGEQDKLTFRFIESGLCGVRLWDTYAGPGAGQRQRREAEVAVALLNEGYPCDLLLERKSFNDIQFYHSVTFGWGQPLFHRLYPILTFIYIAVFAVIVLLVFVAVVRMRRMASSRKPLTDPSRNEGAVPSSKEDPEKVIDSTGPVSPPRIGE